MLIGNGADCHLRLEGAQVAPRHAILTTAPDNSVSIRKLAESGIEVNGVALGPLPQPLLHGDKVTIGGVDLLFVDEHKSGSTQYVSAQKLQELVGAAKARPGAAAGKPTAATGGRIVSLTDGREYQVVGTSLKFGRDASADVVVAGTQVSRRHAEIVQSPRGYILVDNSTNGTWVNGERVQNQRLLARADVIRIGEEEFRFYADAAPAAPAPPAAGPTPVSPTPPPPPPSAASGAPPAAAKAPAPPAVSSPPPPAAQGPASAAKLVSTGYFQAPPRSTPAAAPQPPAASPLPPAPAAAPVAVKAPPQALAKFLVRSGNLKGQRLYVKVPIVNIGRADYNDLVIPDDSVSSQHAKLTRREGVWILTDLGSTNGTLVDGEKVSGDVPIAPGAFVRFGDVQLVFEPTDDDAGMGKAQGTRAMSAVKINDLKPPQGR
ncbi:MAG: FHA domain-containing protein [Gemmatimonadales bacterium]